VGVGDEGSLDGQCGARDQAEDQRTEAAFQDCKVLVSRQTSGPHNDPSSAIHVATGSGRGELLGILVRFCSVLRHIVQYHSMFMVEFGAKRA
jgi:hypothetical protein